MEFISKEIVKLHRGKLELNVEYAVFEVSVRL